MSEFGNPATYKDGYYFDSGSVPLYNYPKGLEAKYPYYKDIENLSPNLLKLKPIFELEPTQIIQDKPVIGEVKPFFFKKSLVDLETTSFLDSKLITDTPVLSALHQLKKGNFQNLLLEHSDSPSHFHGMQEQLLTSIFPELVSNLNIEDVLRMQPGRKIPKNLGDYRLIAITSTRKMSHSSLSAGSTVTIEDGVECNYGFNGKPYLDSGYAIGLVYRDALAAVAGAHIAEDGQLRVVQIQAVDTRAGDPKQKFKTGLHSGFYWRDTLVQAWMNLAPQLGVEEVEIQYSENNFWFNETRRDRFVTGYDAVAQRMGFAQRIDSKNWVHRLGINEAEPSAEQA